jgi:hypothetical protein
MNPRGAVRKSSATTLDGVDIGIIVLALATGLIHLVLLNMFMGHLDLLFTLNGLGYIGLVAALYLPLPWLAAYRNWARLALMAFSAVTILAWLVMGRPYTPLGYITKLIELGLIGLLWVDLRRQR